MNKKKLIILVLILIFFFSLISVGLAKKKKGPSKIDPGTVIGEIAKIASDYHKFGALGWIVVKWDVKHPKDIDRRLLVVGGGSKKGPGIECPITKEDQAITFQDLKVGQKVAVRFDAYPGTVWTGRLDKIHPRSEIRDSNNVFIGEVTLEQTGEDLRPGMKGQATITTSSRWLLWILFHKAWYGAQAWLGM